MTPGFSNGAGTDRSTQVALTRLHCSRDLRAVLQLARSLPGGLAQAEAELQGSGSCEVRSNSCFQFQLACFGYQSLPS